MATVLFAWELGGGLGHCVKVAPLVNGMLARGHRVFFAARDVATAQKVINNASVKFLPAPVGTARRPSPVRSPHSFSEVLAQTGFGDARQLPALVAAWRNLFELVGPQLVVCEHSPTALLACRWTDAQRVVVGTGFSLPPDVSPLPALIPRPGQGFDSPEHELRLLSNVNRLLQRDGLPPLQRLSQLYAETAESLLMTFRELDHHTSRGVAEYFGSGTADGGIDPRWPSGEEPRVLVYLKSLPGPFRLDAALAMLRELPIRALAYVPGAPPNLLKLQCASLRICTEPIDLSRALRQCALCVLNGTSGTATHSLLAGVPLLLIPVFLEQAVFSRRVVELGAGLTCAPNRIELLAARLWRVLRDDRFRLAAQSFAARYATYDPQPVQRELIDRLDSLATGERATCEPLFA